MNIYDLSAIVTVRDRLNTMLNGMRINKDDFKDLNHALIRLDRSFLKGIQELDFDALIPSSGYIQKIEEDPDRIRGKLQEAVIFDEAQLSLPLDHPETAVKIKVVAESNVLAEKSDKENSEDAELALIAQRVNAQKEKLKKEGRSNKRISKAVDDASK